MPLTSRLTHLQTSAILLGCALLLSPAAASAQSPPPVLPVARPTVVPPTVADAPVYRNAGMRIAGIALTATGAAALVAGLVTIGVDLSGCPHNIECGIATVAGGIPLAAGSVLLTGIGIPLWVVGALPPNPGAATALPAWAVPTVTASPRSAALRWTF